MLRRGCESSFGPVAGCLEAFRELQEHAAAQRLTEKTSWAQLEERQLQLLERLEALRVGG